MKILLISDIPPCKNLTAGLVLSALVRFIPKNSICFYVVSNPSVEIELSPEFAQIPMRFDTKPNENWSFLPQRYSLRKLSKTVAFFAEYATEKLVVDSKIKDAIMFGKSQGVDRVWGVLQGQTTIRMVKEVSDGIGVPLHTHVWDPFSWWATAHGLDGKTRNRVQAQFDNAIKASSTVAVASEPMAELYQSVFGVNSIPVMASHSLSLAQKPPVELRGKGTLLIGMAGQFYASSEWQNLLKALKSANWEIAGREVKVVVLGPQKPPGEYVKTNVKYLGWKDQADAAAILSLCDILYCPYPFDEKLKEVSALSFPSKLVLYLASGRPIVFHGPDYASPVRYLRERKCGVSALSLLPTVIYNELERLVRDPNIYRMYAENAQSAFRIDFTLESMRSSFSKFIGSETLQQPGYEQHSLDANTKEFKALQKLAFVRKLSAIYLFSNATAQIKQYALTTKRWLKNNFVSNIPPFKRFYIEINYYVKEVARLRAALSSCSFDESEKSYLIVSSDIENSNEIEFPSDYKNQLFTIVSGDVFTCIDDDKNSSIWDLGEVLRLCLNKNVDEIIIDYKYFNECTAIESLVRILNVSLAFIVDSEDEKSKAKSQFCTVETKCFHRK